MMPVFMGLHRSVSVKIMSVVKDSSTRVVSQFVVQNVAMRLRKLKTSACPVSTLLPQAAA